MVIVLSKEKHTGHAVKGNNQQWRGIMALDMKQSYILHPEADFLYIFSVLFLLFPFYTSLSAFFICHSNNYS